MTAVALTREDTGTVLVVDGATNVGDIVSADVTTHAVPSRQSVASGRVHRPRTGSIDAVVSPTPLLAGTTQGAARIREVLDFLEGWDESDATCSLQVPDEPPIDALVLTSYRRLVDAREGFVLRIDVQQATVAETSSTTRQPLSTQSTQPRADVADGLSDEVDKGAGTTSDKSLTLQLFGG